MIKYLLLIFAVLGVTVFASSAPAKAFDVFGSGTCSSDKAKAQSAVCSAKSSDPIAGQDGLLVKIAYIIGYVAGGAAVIIIVYGSIKYITSEGDPAKVKSAKDSVFFALIGLVVIVLARVLIWFVVDKLK